MTSSWRHSGVYPIVNNKVLMFYLTAKFHDNSVNTFGFIEGGGGGGAFEAPSRPRNSEKDQAE